jgi:orsellinic acid C2-O-methyltransferase
MPGDDAAPIPDAAARVHVASLMDGFLATQLLYVAARLNVADALASGSQSAEALARHVGADATVLRRVLLGLAAYGVLDEHPEGRFSLAAPGVCLRSDGASSLRGAIIARGDLYYDAATGLLEAVRCGGTPFTYVHGLGFFEFLARNPDRGAAFQASMVDRFAPGSRGGGRGLRLRRLPTAGGCRGRRGVLLATILASAPDLRGVLLDQTAVVERARERLESAGLGSRCEFIAGDFFAEVPSGGGAYVLSRVIHNWDDAAAIRILGNCRRAMAPGDTLLLVELVMPDRAADQPMGVRMDIHMLMLLPGRERTVAEYERLLETANFRLVRVVPTQLPSGISVIEAIPAPHGPAKEPSAHEERAC